MTGWTPAAVGPAPIQQPELAAAATASRSAHFEASRHHTYTPNNRPPLPDSPTGSAQVLGRTDNITLLLPIVDLPYGQRIAQYSSKNMYIALRQANYTLC
jgi:hypothetical protein